MAGAGVALEFPLHLDQLGTLAAVVEGDATTLLHPPWIWSWVPPINYLPHVTPITWETSWAIKVGFVLQGLMNKVGLPRHVKNITPSWYSYSGKISCIPIDKQTEENMVGLMLQCCIWK